MMKANQHLECPVCENRINRGSIPGPKGTIEAEIGQLTECEHCLSMLEYVSRANVLACRPASQQRTKSFNRLATDTGTLRLAAVLDYVIRYGRMPREQR